MIFWKLCYKISPFWAFFLEFFGLGNNLTLQDHYYTRAITLILSMERNKKIIFQWGFSCKTCKNSYEFLAPQDKILARFLALAENTSNGSTVCPTLHSTVFSSRLFSTCMKVFLICVRAILIRGNFAKRQHFYEDYDYEK